MKSGIKEMYNTNSYGPISVYNINISFRNHENNTKPSVIVDRDIILLQFNNVCQNENSS